MKKQVFYSFVLATLSFIAARFLQDFGVEEYYHKQALNFNREDGYFNLENPNKIQTLPSGLLPFSDMTILDSSHVLALQGARKSLVMYNMDLNEFSAMQPLGMNGAIQDIVAVDSLIYLFDDAMKVYVSSFPFDSSKTTLVSEQELDWESAAVCHHPLTHRLFVAPYIESEEESSLRSIYAYNLNKNYFSQSPLFSFDVEVVESFANENGIKISSFKVSQLMDTILGLTLKPSSIAVHPKTNEVYLLSTDDRALVVFNQFGEIQNFAVLDPVHFPSPRGMSFAKNGDLLISNDDLMHNTLVRISWNKLYQSKKGKGLIFGR